MRQWLRDRIVALLDNLFGAGVLAALAILLPLPVVTRAAVITVFLFALLLLLREDNGDRVGLPLGALGRTCRRLLFQVKLALALYMPVMSSAPAFPPGAAPPGAPDEPRRGRAKLRDTPLDADLRVERWEPDTDPYLELTISDEGKVVPLRIAEAVRTRATEGWIGRNDPCWCGSGKKYKKCHGA